MQFPKAQRQGLGQAVTWTSGRFTVLKGRIQVAIKEEIVTAVRDDLGKFEQSNVIVLKELEEFVGRCECIASLIFILRPFVSMMRAPLYSKEATNAPQNCCWSKQLETPMVWLRAFLTDNPEYIVRNFSLNDYRNRGVQISVITDASPWGLGRGAMRGRSYRSLLRRCHHE